MTVASTGNNAALEVRKWGWTQQPGSVTLARKLYIKWLSRVGASHLEADAVLCFSELLTNAIRIPSPDGFTDTTWSVYPDKVRAEVRDYSSEAPYVCPADLEAESGRGLFLVHLLADDWGYEHCRFLDGKGGYVSGKRVWFELKR